MKILIQRVSQAQVFVADKVIGKIEKGLLVFVGIVDDDDFSDVDWLVKKILQLRIFDDENNNMNLSIQDIKGEILIISQFTLHALTKKGNRPSFIKAAKPSIALPLYENFLNKMEMQFGKKIEKGIFGAAMEVHLINDGPVTIIMNSKNKE